MRKDVRCPSTMHLTTGKPYRFRASSISQNRNIFTMRDRRFTAASFLMRDGNMSGYL